ncbi:MAG: exo-alpha-sialidase [Verrucomicrobiales bacterium]|nr:exo-alpha-sialidase [Verrucomicrobiales bacterium]
MPSSTREGSALPSPWAALALSLALGGHALPAASPPPPAPPLTDLAHDTQRQVVVDREPGQYLGHPTTVLLEDGRTILCVYPQGHGKGPICLKRSLDGGLTWSARLPVPENWATSRETPTLHRVTDAAGKRRLIVWSGLYPARLAVSEDDGNTWTPLRPAGDWGGIVVMGSVEPLREWPGRYLAWFHDDGRFFQSNPAPAAPVVFRLYQVESGDGGLSWTRPREIQSSSEVHLCEPGVVRSPHGKQLALLLRENARRRLSHVMTSEDEGRTWSAPREVGWALTGDRHTARYLHDGRLFVSFRDTAPGSPTAGDWLAWVGTYEDILQARPGQHRIRLMDNHNAWDSTYPGVEVLPDGTVVTTTYGHWTQGEQPYVVSVRWHPSELTETRP